jgi:hypothetical protein
MAPLLDILVPRTLHASLTGQLPKALYVRLHSAWNNHDSVHRNVISGPYPLVYDHFLSSFTTVASIDVVLDRPMAELFLSVVSDDNRPIFLERHAISGRVGDVLRVPALDIHV